jgi:hypothetical protein
MNEDINVEAECKNCNHPISLHTPKCHIQYREFDRDRLCGCERPQYYGAIISDTNIGWTEFHCNNCGKLTSFLNSIDENIYEIMEDQLLLCTNCIEIKE